jgi:hypothetical protein
MKLATADGRLLGNFLLASSGFSSIECPDADAST